MTTTKTFSVQKLSDGSLANTSGGKLSLEDKLIAATSDMACLGLLGAMGCLTASAILQSKAQSALRDGNIKQHNKFNTASKNLAIGASACGGLWAVNSISNRIIMHYLYN